MDFELPEELRLLQENVRRFVERELIPLEREVVNDVKLQKELPQRLRGKAQALGLWLYDVPREFGGLGVEPMAVMPHLPEGRRGGGEGQMSRSSTAGCWVDGMTMSYSCGGIFARSSSRDAMTSSVDSPGELP